MAHIVCVKNPVKTPASLLLLAAFSGVLAVPAAGQSFMLVNPGGLAYASYGLSGDGHRVVGGTSIGNGNSGAFLWTRGSEYSVFGLEPGVRANSEARAISGDGQVIYGNAGRDTNAAGVHAFRWTGTGTYHELPTLQGYTSSFIRATNGNGSIAVGYAQFGRQGNGTPTQACYWSGNTVTALESDYTAEALGISRDGSTIVGGQGSAGGNGVAMVWRPGQGSQVLPGLLNNPSTGGETARGANADGSVIVGQSGSYVVDWVDGEVHALLRPNGQLTLGSALATSDDGSVIVGSFRFDDVQFGVYVAGVWTSETGAISLADYLTQNGVSVPAGVTLTDVFAVSADGRTFSGSSSQGAFVATIPSPGAAAWLIAGLGVARARRTRVSKCRLSEAVVPRRT